jgi:uncharacterized membrane protein AbrB (regulator of aidB expression)
MLVALMASGAVGAFVARALRVPLWPMTGAIVGAAVLHLVLGGASQVPAWWSLLAQVLVGTAVGSRVNPGLVREFRAVLVPGTVAVLSIVLAGIGLGLAIAVTGLAAAASVSRPASQVLVRDCMQAVCTRCSLRAFADDGTRHVLW